MKNVTVLSSCLLLSACTTATPSLIGNHYYMMGDAACVEGQFVSDTRMMCFDKKGRETGYRDGLTAEALQAQQAAAYAQQQNQSQALSQAFQSFNQAVQPYAAPQTSPSYPTYTPPQVYQPQLSKPADHYYCTTTGGVTTCREL